MRRALLGLAVSFPIALPSASEARQVSCAKVSYQAGGGYYDYVSTKIRGTRVRCATARRVAHVKPESVSGTGSATRRFNALKFACRGKASEDAEGRERVDFRCLRATSVITFTWAPQ